MARKTTKAAPAETTIASQEENTVLKAGSEVGDEASTEENFDEYEQAGEMPVTVGGQEITNADLAKAIMALVQTQTAVAQSVVHKVPYANHKPRSTFNPAGNKKRKLKRRCYQNGYPMNIALLHDVEIEALNRLKGGKYLNGLVTVRTDDRGEDSTLNILYRNKSIDERMALKSEFRNLTEFLKRAVEEGPMVDD